MGFWRCPVTPYKGSETWILVGYVGAVPQYKAPGSPVLPRRLATANATARGYRAVFRDTPPKVDTGPAVDWGTVGDVLWYGFIFGIAWGGC